MIHAQAMCAKCQAVVELTLEPPKLLNFQSFSMWILEHPLPVVCSNPLCCAVLIPVVGQINDIKIGTAIKPETAMQNLVIPVGGG
jgi:hypothetical protein